MPRDTNHVHNFSSQNVSKYSSLHISTTGLPAEFHCDSFVDKSKNIIDKLLPTFKSQIFFFPNNLLSWKKPHSSLKATVIQDSFNQVTKCTSTSLRTFRPFRPFPFEVNSG